MPFAEVVPLALAFTAVFGTPVHDSTPCSYVCNALLEALPGAVSFPNSTLYEASNVYWSVRQSEGGPSCFVYPSSSGEVATILKLLVEHNSIFTVKSGGHTPFPSGSNIEDHNGVTIDLHLMSQVTLSPDKTTVSIGPGARWIDVSQTLDPLGLAVIGGRAGSVGVPGLILGGGISYFSGRHGWACDNVRSFEVVTAQGEIVPASQATNPALYRALRGGGGSSFGVVTRFDLAVFPQGDMWHNQLSYPSALNASMIPLFTNFTVNGLSADPDAHGWLVNVHLPGLGSVALLDLFHSTAAATTPTPDIPPVFLPFNAPQPQPAIRNETTVSNISTLSRTLAHLGTRHTWWTITVRILVDNPAVFHEMMPLFEAHATRLLTAAANTSPPDPVFIPWLIFHPIPLSTLTAMQKNGGNALGLTPSDGPLMIVQLGADWTDPSLDDLVEETSQHLIGQIAALAASKGVHKDFVYMNYAGSRQDVLRSYGPESYEMLVTAVRTWDPEGALRKLWKGHFRVGG